MKGGKVKGQGGESEDFKKEFQEGVDHHQCQMLLKSKRVRREKRSMDLCKKATGDFQENCIRRVERADLDFRVTVW